MRSQVAWFFLFVRYMSRRLLIPALIALTSPLAAPYPFCIPLSVYGECSGSLIAQPMFEWFAEVELYQGVLMSKAKVPHLRYSPLFRGGQTGPSWTESLQRFCHYVPLQQDQTEGLWFKQIVRWSLIIPWRTEVRSMRSWSDAMYDNSILHYYMILYVIIMLARVHFIRVSSKEQRPALIKWSFCTCLMWTRQAYFQSSPSYGDVLWFWSRPSLPLKKMESLV